MTRKDYIQTASILNEYMTDAPSIVMSLAHDFANYFADDNPRFNYDKFITAVAGEGLLVWEHLIQLGSILLLQHLAYLFSPQYFFLVLKNY